MIQYSDGSFGAIAPAKDILDMLHAKFNSLEQDKQEFFKEYKAVHFGTISELDLIRNNSMNFDAVMERLSELEREVATLKPKGPIKIYSMSDLPVGV